MNSLNIIKYTFEVPHNLRITAIITEKGLTKPRVFLSIETYPQESESSIGVRTFKALHYLLTEGFINDIKEVELDSATVEVYKE